MKTSVLIILGMLTFSTIFAQKTETKEPTQTEKQGIIVFKSLVYDFGTIPYASPAVAVFTFKNITKSPIKLTNVKTSCGCTGAEWPREEIAKKKKGKITVTYDSKRVGKFNKTVYVYVEGQENAIQLEIKGEVSPQEGSVPTEGKSVEGKDKSDGTNNQSGSGNVDKTDAINSGSKSSDVKKVSTDSQSFSNPEKKVAIKEPKNIKTQ
jgi:hypothetical protein